MSNVIVALKTRELDTLGRQLAGWLQGKMPAARDIRIDNLAYPFGAGQSHETILFDASWTEGGERRDEGMVVRIKPVDLQMFPTDLFHEQAMLMSLLHEDGRVKVARIFWYEEDPSLLGAPFFVMEKKRGRVAVSVPPYAQTGWVAEAAPDQRRRMWENGVRQLAAIQLVPRDRMDFLQGPPGAREGLDQEWERYQRFHARNNELRPWPLFDRAFEVLAERWPKNQPPGLVWGDARIGNMMFDEDFEVVAVMDWEQPSLGGALQDLSWWLRLSDMMHSTGSGRPHLEGMGTHAETVALWREITGVSTDDLDWYEDFTSVKLAMLSIRMGHLRGAPTPTEAWPDSPIFRALAQRLEIRWPD
jgi:aminoglycoside phosphotransferase (APT) family kinase protein